MTIGKGHDSVDIVWHGQQLPQRRHREGHVRGDHRHQIGGRQAHSRTDRRSGTTTRGILPGDRHSSADVRVRTDHHNGDICGNLLQHPVDHSPAGDLHAGLVLAEPATAATGEHDCRPGEHTRRLGPRRCP